jgi:uncharacterized protein (TIGR02145 family)
MKNNILIIGFLFIWVFTCCKKDEETTIRIEGTVTDTLGNALYSVNVRLSAGAWGGDLYYGNTKTDINGYYSIEHKGCLKEYTSYIEATILGYHSQRKDPHGCTEDLQVINFVLVPISISHWNCGDLLVDERDGKKYATVQIGAYCWMAENLNIGNRIDGIHDQTDNDVIEKYCYDDNEENCDVFGGLYQWDEIMRGDGWAYSGICPSGWHIPDPSYALGDWGTLLNYLGGVEVAGGKMKEIGTTHWNSPNTGATNQSGFTALPGGGYDNIENLFRGKGMNASFWCSASNTSEGKIYLLSYDSDTVYSHMYPKSGGHSVRCVADKQK